MDTGETIAAASAPPAPPTTPAARPGLQKWPVAYPASSSSNDEVWIGAARFLGRTDGATDSAAANASAIEAARSMSHRAADHSAHAAKAAGDAASLRWEAAEAKRLAGFPAEAFEDYEALTRHHLANGSLKSAIAFMRKALHVSDVSEDVEVHVGARLLAAKTYVAARQPERALEMADAAKAMAEGAGFVRPKADAVALRELAKWTPALRHGRCACGRGIEYSRCCGAADTEPVEFLEEARRLFGEIVTGARRQRGLRALETLMRPSQGTDDLTWYAWSVEDGCYRLVAYPNWSGRALRAAEFMAGVARERKCAASVSSAILQSFVAIEAFLNSWKSLARMSVGEEVETPKDTQPEGRRDKRGKNEGRSKVVGGWTKAVHATFGDECPIPDREGFEKLAELRNELVHSAAPLETVFPRAAEPNGFVDFFTKAECELGPEPAPWMDRIMMPDVADWAVGIAKAQIAAVREAWDVTDCARVNREWWLGIAQDADDDMEEGPSAEPMHASFARPTPDETERTGLRRLARRGPDAIAEIEDAHDGRP